MVVLKLIVDVVEKVLKLTLDILVLMMMSKKKVLDVFSGGFKGYTR